jgi:hypothetical protein
MKTVRTSRCGNGVFTRLGKAHQCGPHGQKKKNCNVSGSLFASRPFKYDLEERLEGRNSVRVLHPPHCNISGKCLGVSVTYFDEPEKKIHTPSAIPSGGGTRGTKALASTLFSW